MAVIAGRHVRKWEDIAPYLQISVVGEEEIRRSGDYTDQKRTLLQKWREVKGNEATYKALSDAALKANNKDLSDQVIELALV